MGKMIKKIIVKNGNQSQEVPVGQVSPEVADKIVINESGNVEVLSSGLNVKSKPQKINLNSVGDIQLKPGNDSTLQIDVENDSTNPSEAAVKICNGAYKDASKPEVVSLKLNTAGLTLDTQKAFSDEFDKSEFEIKYRCDKWNSGVEKSDGSGPIYAKHKARAFDFRCYDHGGIALQIAGHDNEGHENKIKFESDRIYNYNEDGQEYCGEGGKGVEFGTFNTEHASLYTGDYRFKGEGKVYGATRGDLEKNSKDKVDYPKQSDDFADIISESNQATWNEIIRVARDYADGTLVGGGAGVEDEEGNRIDMSLYATRAFAETIESTANEALTKANLVAPAAGVISKSGSGNLKISSAVYDIAEVHHTDEEGNTIIDVPEYKAALNLESNGNVKIAPKGNLEISSPMLNVNPSKNEISMAASKITLGNGEAVVPIEAENGISLGITSRIISIGTKVSTKGKLENADATLELAYLNNNPNTAYVVGGKVHIPYDLKDYYKAGSTEETPVYYDPAVDSAKTLVYTDVTATTALTGDGVCYIKSKSDNNIWVVEYEAGAMKKLNATKPTNHGILSQLEGFENTIIEPIDYVAPSTATSIASGAIDTYASVKISDLIGLVRRVEVLENKVASYESLLSRIEALESHHALETPEDEAPVDEENPETPEE